ncbi:MAG TPA: sigma-70 family RNA polymerase sigma factor [Ilumatobacteraceae bacterium]|nr:sigma-70 family RNA polymerase sigma factor [Ilumatobacteraceae bacterium]
MANGFIGDRSFPTPPPVVHGVWNASDEALVAGLGVGDTDVARVLVRRFQGRVYGLALSIIRDRAAAEEVAQDTFVRAWRYAASFDPRRGSAAAWLLAIARNTSLDYVRARGRLLDRLPLEPLDALPDLADADQIVSPRDAIAPVAAAMRALPQEQRDTLMAAAYYGFTAKEISEAWNVPLGTVKSRLRVALFKLREGLTEVPL